MSQANRRLVAIMFTDMVGYTALGQMNESLSLALVEEQRKLLRPVFQRHNGREVKTIGDAFMVEFPSALEAVRCAYDIQRAARELNISLPEDRRVHLRIGIHLGDVVESDNDISGDAVNVASRIESLAEDGGVCLTRQVYDQVKNKFELALESMGKRDLKNVNAPIEVYRMVMPWEVKSHLSGEELDRRRVAVLPFYNMSSNPEDEYFADGMTEELITTLSKLSQLSVISRTSVMQYRKVPKPLKEVARELEVGTILEGSVRKAGQTFRITVQMIDAVEDKHLWAESYDRDLHDVFAVQGEIAKKIADTLEVRLIDSERARIEKPPTQDVDANALYLRGNYHFHKFTKEGLDQSLEFYKQALERDPKYALAYRGMASTYQWLGFLNYLPEKDAYPKARELAERAIELDDTLGECHSILGQILLEYYWAFSTAEREMRRSMELNPNDARTQMAYSWLLASRLEKEEAIAHAERAVQLDPNSAETWMRGVYTFYLIRQFDRGIEFGLKAVELAPLDPASHLLLSLCCIFAGKPEEAIKEGREAAALSNNAVYFKSNLGFIYGFAGKSEEARRELDDLVSASRTEHVAPMLFAWVYASLGDADHYFEWVQKACEERSSYLVYMKFDIYTDKFRSDPRFKALMEKIGLGA